MSGGPSQSTTTTSAPKWASQMDRWLSEQGIGTLTGGPTNIAQMPPGALSSVAGLTPDQLAAISNIENVSGQAGQVGSAGANMLTNQLQGDYLNPATNPYLAATYAEAAAPMVQQYETATAPSTMAAEQTAAGGGPGALSGSTAFGEETALNQYGLGQNLANLGTNIYGGAYEQGVQNQLTAAGLEGAVQSGLYAPANALLGAGTIQQQQQQNVLDTNTQNALAQANWPVSRLSDIASIVQSLQSGQGSVLGPNPTASKM